MQANGTAMMHRPHHHHHGGDLYEILDLILDKGLVVDLWARVSLVGIEILRVEARVVIASVNTFLRYAAAIAEIERPEPMALSDLTPDDREVIETIAERTLEKVDAALKTKNAK